MSRLVVISFRNHCSKHSSISSSTKSMRRSVQLADRGESHVRTDKEAAQNELLRHMAQSNLHKFCPGQMQGHIAKDDLAMGYRRLADTSKIADFIERTLRDAGAIHANVLEEESEVNVENHTMPILPNMTLDGRLVVGNEFEINSFTHHIATDETASSLGTTEQTKTYGCKGVMRRRMARRQTTAVSWENEKRVMTVRELNGFGAGFHGRHVFLVVVNLQNI